MVDRWSYCETMAATGCWHIRRLTDAGRKPTGGADTKTLCGFQAAWDVPAQPRKPFEFRPHEVGGWPPGNTCKMCSEAWEEARNNAG